MDFSREELASLDSLFHLIKLRNYASGSMNDDAIKYEQIIAYLRIIDAEVRRLSKKRPLVFVESAAGNCYLSFLVYYYYGILCKRPVEIHCIDTNERLMDNCRAIAGNLPMAFTELSFHAMDINDFDLGKDIDFAYSLHACDVATDKALFLGIRNNARCIFSVCCCQETVTRYFRSSALPGVSRYKSLKEKLVYIIVDAMRAHLLIKNGYSVDIFDFVSSRITDRNTILRARRDNNVRVRAVNEEYDQLKNGFSIRPELEKLLAGKQGKAT